MNPSPFTLPLLAAIFLLGVEPLHGQKPPNATGPATGSPLRTPAFFYDSQRGGNDFGGAKPLAALGFTDVHGGVAALGSGKLILTPQAGGGADTLARDCVLRTGGAEQARDQGCRVVLPANYRTGPAAVGLCLRFQAAGSGLLLGFAPDTAAPLSVYSVAGGVATPRGQGPLVGTYNPANPVAVEARALMDSAVALTVIDLTTDKIIGFLSVPLDFGGVPAGSFGLVAWTTAAGRGSIAVANAQSFPVTAVMCDGDSLTSGENNSIGKGTASPLATAYPGVLQKLLGSRYFVHNLGRGGYTIPVIAGDANHRVDEFVAKAEQPPIVIIEGGTNDMGIDGSIKPPVSVTQAAQTVYSRLQGYWAARHAARADTTVIDISNTPAQHPAYVSNLGSLSGFNQRRDALNQLRKNTTTGPRPDFLADVTADGYIGHDGNEQNPRYFDAKDKTHLTDAGYERKAGIVAAVILHSAK